MLSKLFPFLRKARVVGAAIYSLCTILEIGSVCIILFMIHLLFNHLELPQLIHLVLQLVRRIHLFMNVTLLVLRFELLQRSELVLVLNLIDILVTKYRLECGVLLTEYTVAMSKPVLVGFDGDGLSDVH